MTVPISPARGRLRFGLAPGLTAAARGLAFAALMLAGLGLLLIVLAAPALTLAGAAMLVVGHDMESSHKMLLTIVLLLVGPGLGRFALPAALLGLRHLACLTRRLAGAWCGVPIAEAYQPRPAGALTFTRRLGWLLRDRATWRDLLWTAVNGVAGCILAALAAIIIGVGLVAFVGPELVHTIPRPAFGGNSAGSLIVLGLAIAATGVLAARRCCAATGCWPARCWRLARPS